MSESTPRTSYLPGIAIGLVAFAVGVFLTIVALQRIDYTPVGTCISGCTAANRGMKAVFEDNVGLIHVELSSLRAEVTLLRQLVVSVHQAAVGPMDSDIQIERPEL